MFSRISDSLSNRFSNLNFHLSADDITRMVSESVYAPIAAFNSAFTLRFLLNTFETAVCEFDRDTLPSSLWDGVKAATVVTAFMLAAKVANQIVSQNRNPSLTNEEKTDAETRSSYINNSMFTKPIEPEVKPESSPSLKGAKCI